MAHIFYLCISLILFTFNIILLIYNIYLYRKRYSIDFIVKSIGEINELEKDNIKQITNIKNTENNKN